MLSTQLINAVVEWERRLDLKDADGRNHRSVSPADSASNPNRFEMHLDSVRDVDPRDLPEEAYCCGSLTSLCSSDCFMVIDHAEAV
jgi:hypothetical protein